MKQLVSIGETMVSLVSHPNESIKYGASLKMRIAGAESNTLIGTRKLGHRASFISKLGKDSFGQFILRMIRAEDVDTSYVSFDCEHSTGIMFKELNSQHDTIVQYYRSNSAAAHLSPTDIPEVAIATADMFHFTGITPILSESCEATIHCALEIASSNNCDISFDPNIRYKLWKNNDYSNLMRQLIQKSNHILLGLSEAKVLYDTDKPEQIMQHIFRSPSIKTVSLKNGANGAWVSDGEKCIFLPPVPCHCIDPIGAGDAFNAGFLSSLLDQKSLEECGYVASLMGAKATESFGDIEGLLLKEELADIMNNTISICR